MNNIYILGAVSTEEAAENACGLLGIVKKSVDYFRPTTIPSFGFGAHMVYEGFYLLYAYGYQSITPYLDVLDEAMSFVDNQIPLCENCRYKGCPQDPHTCGYWVVKAITEASENWEG